MGNKRIIEALRIYQQADEEGVLCVVSRQAVDEAAQALEAQEWRTNVDQVPWGKLVLISNKGAIRIAFRSQVNGAWQSEYDYGLEVPTHWKPLTPPETE